MTTNTFPSCDVAAVSSETNANLRTLVSRLAPVPNVHPVEMRDDSFDLETLHRNAAILRSIFVAVEDERSGLLADFDLIASAMRTVTDLIDRHRVCNGGLPINAAISLHDELSGIVQLVIEESERPGSATASAIFGDGEGFNAAVQCALDDLGPEMARVMRGRLTALAAA